MKNFTQISNVIIKDISISDSAFRTYLMLKTFKYGSSKVFPSEKTLADLRGKTSRTVISHLKQLKEKGYIEYKKRGFSASNIYKFIGEEKFTNDSVISEVNDTSMVKKSSRLLLQKLHPNNTKSDNTKINNTFEYKIVEKGLKKVLDENPWLKSKRSRLLDKKSIK